MTINVVPVQQQQNGLDCGVICHSLCFKPYIKKKTNITFQKLQYPDLMKCLKEQCHEDFAVLGQFCAKIIFEVLIISKMLL